MKKNNFFVAQSPLQLLNCIEAQYKFKTQNNILIFIESGHLQTEFQMKRLLKLFKWKDIIYIHLPTTKIENITFVAEVRKKLKYYLSHKIEKVFIGDFRGFQMLHIANYLSAEEVYLVDDGISTVSYDNYIQFKSIQKTLSKLKHRAFFYKTKQINYNFFTIYDMKEKRKVFNNYDFINTYKSNSEVKDEIFFIGQPLVKLGIVSKEYYQENLKKIIDLHRNEKLVYVMHRIEDEAYIKELSHQFGFDYRRFDDLLELEMIRAVYLPKTFATFYSSALFSMSQLFKNLDYIAYRIDTKEIKYKGLKILDIDHMYDQFKKYGIRVEVI